MSSKSDGRACVNDGGPGCGNREATISKSRREKETLERERQSGREKESV